MSQAEKTTSQVLQEARALVAAGWCQGPYSYWEEIDGQQCYCAVGAVYTVLGLVLGAVPPAEAALDAAAVALSGGAETSAIGWNEDPRHTQADVLALFDRALAEVTN